MLPTENKVTEECGGQRYTDTISKPQQKVNLIPEKIM